MINICILVVSLILLNLISGTHSISHVLTYYSIPSLPTIPKSFGMGLDKSVNLWIYSLSSFFLFLLLYQKRTLLFPSFSCFCRKYLCLLGFFCVSRAVFFMINSFLLLYVDIFFINACHDHL